MAGDLKLRTDECAETQHTRTLGWYYIQQQWSRLTSQFPISIHSPPYSNAHHTPHMTHRPYLPDHLTTGSPQSNITWLLALDKTRSLVCMLYLNKPRQRYSLAFLLLLTSQKNRTQANNIDDPATITPNFTPSTLFEFDVWKCTDQYRWVLVIPKRKIWIPAWLFKVLYKSHSYLQNAYLPFPNHSNFFFLVP